MAILDFGPPERSCDLIFLHANGFNALTYRQILAPLADRFRILAVDQRGHGGSTLPAVAEGRDDWGDFREDLLALLATLNAKGVVLAGHSMGGATCLGAAARAPDAAGRLVLFDPVIMPPGAVAQAKAGGPIHSRLIDGARRRRAEFPNRGAALHAYGARAAFSTWRPDMLADYVEDGFRELPDGGVRLACEPAWEASTFAAQANDPWADFADAEVPIEILKAERDSTCRTDEAGPALTADGRVNIVTVRGTGHFLPMERPELATEALFRALTLKR